MYIEKEEKSRCPQFKDVAFGECFEEDGCYYIKVIDENNSPRAVRLTTGRIVSFSDLDDVRKITLSVKVK